MAEIHDRLANEKQGYFLSSNNDVEYLITNDGRSDILTNNPLKIFRRLLTLNANNRLKINL